MKAIKGFIAGVMVTVMVMGGAVYAAGAQQSISVVLNNVNLKVNGVIVKADNILYNGTTYVPLRAVADAFGKETGWDAGTMTASINEKGSVPAPAPSPAPIATTKSYKAGMYKVGTDIPAGEYVLIGESTAYFQVSKDSVGSLESIVSNDNFTGRSYVTVESGQYLDIKRAIAYPSASAPKVTPVNNTLPEGMYKVGVDLAAGEYKVTSSGMGYVEVSTSSKHDLMDVVSNDNFSGEKYVTVKDGQYVKISRATLALK